MSKKQFFEEMQFDNYQYALDFKKDAEERLAKANSIFKLSVIATIVGILVSGLRYLLIPKIILIATIIVSVICYMKLGRIKTILGWAWKLATIGWYLVPVFPIDLILGLGLLILVPYYMLLCPVVLVCVFKRQAKKDIEQADEYLKYFKSYVVLVCTTYAETA